MANKPVIGTVICPHCQWKNVVSWNGNFQYICVLCKKPFRVKRQRVRKICCIKATKGCKSDGKV